jgi:hypothetical protein
MPLKRSEVSAWVLEMQTAMATVVDQCSNLRTQLPSYAAPPPVKRAPPVVSPLAPKAAVPAKAPAPAIAPAHKVIFAKPKPAAVVVVDTGVVELPTAPSWARSESTASNLPQPPGAEVRKPLARNRVQPLHECAYCERTTKSAPPARAAPQTTAPTCRSRF